MRAAPEFETIRPSLFFWQVYEPAVKTDLCCCALETASGLVFCDPIPLSPDALAELLETRTPRAILLTNANHERGSKELARQLGIEIWANSAARSELPATRWFDDGETLFDEIEPIALPGFAPGETAFWRDGLLVLGDALIHAGHYGFSVLPEKYCEDAKLGKQSLKKLTDYPVDLMTFAHGLPIVSRARERLASLIH